jgi:hypothetical protein
MKHISHLVFFWVLIVRLIFTVGEAVDLGPIDIVYTWVDGSDPAWQATRSQLLAHEKKTRVAPDALGKKRSRNRDELLYSLRSVYAYAPFVRQIFIVTNGQVPAWLKPHPKITLVPHKDICDPNNLPTFNSMAIEAVLHKIPGLAERYIYFNDDVFLGRGAYETDFFTQEGEFKFFLSQAWLPTGKVQKQEIAYFSACKNTAKLLDKHFGTVSRYEAAHAPFPSFKSVVERVEQQFSFVFTKVASHRFRSSRDYTLTNGLIPYVGCYMGKGTMVHVPHRTISYSSDIEANRWQLDDIQRNQYLFFCINDDDDKTSKKAHQLLKDFFESYYPTKAPWEN